MSIDHHPFVFIHIGKTAGSSVRASLSDYFPAGKTCPLVFHQQINELPDEDRASYDLFCAHIGFDAALSLAKEPQRIFSLLRDPIDRVLSLYDYWREVESAGGGKGPALAKKLSLDDFLESRVAAVVVDVHNTQTWQLAVAHDAPTRREMKKQLSEDALFERALQNVESLGVIGVQEHLGQFIATLNATYDWSLPQPERLNTTSNRTGRNQVPMTTRGKIQALNAMDLELYAHVLQRYVLTSSE